MRLLPWQPRQRLVAATVVAIIVVINTCDNNSLCGVSATSSSYLQQQQVDSLVMGMDVATEVSPAAVASLSYYCSYDTCQCSADLREITCRGVGFTRVPTPLPTTLVKL
ncbi:hypothetical protein C0J52_02858 [Blattella germanica]|nr:hypothetical protein C0J52_02858 [Blattella germanica]